MHIQTERAARSVCAYTQKAHDKNVRMHQHQVRGEQPRPRGRVSRRRYYYWYYLLSIIIRLLLLLLSSYYYYYYLLLLLLSSSRGAYRGTEARTASIQKCGPGANKKQIQLQIQFFVAAAAIIIIVVVVVVVIIIIIIILICSELGFAAARLRHGLRRGCAAALKLRAVGRASRCRRRCAINVRGRWAEGG